MSLQCHRVQLFEPVAHLSLAFFLVFLPTFCSQAGDGEEGTVIVISILELKQ